MAKAIFSDLLIVGLVFTGVLLLTGNWGAGVAFGGAAGWFAYQLVK